jgi:hypothetical protein
MKKIALIFGIVVLAGFFIRFVVGGDEDTWICDKQKREWVQHGNPSATKPETPCGDAQGDKLNQTEGIMLCDDGLGNSMEYSRAEEIAIRSCKDGSLKNFHYCNNVTGTWWIDFVPSEPKEGCNPACVVNIKTGEAEINWRCMGLVPQE